MRQKKRLVEKTMKDMLETLSGVEKYVLIEKIVDLQQRIDKANQLIEKQKKKMQDYINSNEEIVHFHSLKKGFNDLVEDYFKKVK